MAIDTTTRTEVQHYKNYIGGEWVDAASGETFDVVNPATEEVFATVPKRRPRGRAARDRRGARGLRLGRRGPRWRPRSASASCCR